MEASAQGISIGSREGVGVRVAELRRRAGLSRKALAKQLGISLWTLEELEGGRKDAGPYAASISRAIGFPLELDPVTFGVLETRESAFAFSVYRARDRGGFDASGVQ